MSDEETSLPKDSERIMKLEDNFVVVVELLQDVQKSIGHLTSTNNISQIESGAKNMSNSTTTPHPSSDVERHSTAENEREIKSKKKLSGKTSGIKHSTQKQRGLQIEKVTLQPKNNQRLPMDKIHLTSDLKRSSTEDKSGASRSEKRKASTETLSMKRLFDPDMKKKKSAPETEEKIQFRTQIVHLIKKESPNPTRKQSEVDTSYNSTLQDNSLPGQTNNFKDATNLPELLKFDGRISTLNRWLYQLESLGTDRGWDEHILIKTMKENLQGDLLQWLSIQGDDEVSWKEWKKRLDVKWRTDIGMMRADKLKLFVDTYRHQDENILDFYENQVELGTFCELSDYMICQVIIQRLRNPLLEEGAYSAKCVSTKSLFEYLKNSIGKKRFKHDVLKCDICNRHGHLTAHCYSVRKHSVGFRGAVTGAAARGAGYYRAPRAPP